jgi:hypothetical protein
MISIDHEEETQRGGGIICAVFRVVAVIACAAVMSASGAKQSLG